MIAALFVATGGCYFGLDGIDPWDEKRDARLYRGPYPVVAHPPCARWCRLAGLVESQGGKKRGEDDGCFASALASVRSYGGILEHPAFSDAWPTFDLPIPTEYGGWQRNMFDPGWSCQVEQSWYGHPAPKKTWLYAVDVELIDLRCGPSPYATGVVSTSRRRHGIPEIKKSPRSATPLAFRDLLIAMARSVTR